MIPPSNFSWVVPDLVAASAFPSKYNEFVYLNQIGIKAIINLTHQKYEKSLIDKLTFLTIYHLPIKDFSVPQGDQIHEFLKIMELHVAQGEAVLVHCFAGCGRTGTMLALFLCTKKYFEKKLVIAELRNIRPCSIETPEQENLVKTFCKEFLKN